ncbi:hypothetical protein [Desulfitobacterium dehalogenans]|nr:hypothetical protein [Desulfitobacterium dehalogenans]
MVEIHGEARSHNLSELQAISIAQAAMRKLGWEPVVTSSGGGSDAN